MRIVYLIFLLTFSTVGAISLKEIPLKGIKASDVCYDGRELNIGRVEHKILRVKKVLNASSVFDKLHRLGFKREDSLLFSCKYGFYLSANYIYRRYDGAWVAEPGVNIAIYETSTGNNVTKFFSKLYNIKNPTAADVELSLDKALSIAAKSFFAAWLSSH